MPKGKKFDAAQKHFEGKRIEYEKKLKALNARISEQNKIISEQEEKIRMISSDNEQLNDWVERLLEYTELSKEDIKEACEKDKKLSTAASLLGVLGRFGGY